MKVIIHNHLPQRTVDIGERQTYVDWRPVSKEDYDNHKVGDKIKGGQVVVGKRIQGKEYQLQIKWKGP